MNLFRGIKFPTVLFSSIIIIVTWSLLEGWFPIVRRKWIFVAVGCIYSFLFIQKKYFTSKQFIFLIFYEIVIFFNIMFGDKYFPNYSEWIFDFLALTFPVVLLSYCFENNDRKNISCILCAYFFVLLFTSVASLVIDSFLLPNAIRRMTSYSITLNQMDVVYDFYKLGLSSYSFPHSVHILIPVFIYGIRNQHLPRKLHLACWILLIATMVLVYLSGVMTSLVLSIMFLIIAFSTKRGTLYDNMPRFLVAFLLFLPLLNNNISNFFIDEGISFVGEESYFYGKLVDIKDGLNNPEEESTGDWSERQDLYQESLDRFGSNILVGSNERMGHHSVLLDRLGTLGLVGFIPFIVFLLLQLKSVSKSLHSRSLLFYYEACFAGILMIALKSCFSVELWIVFFLIMPLSLYYLSSFEENDYC